MTDIVSPEVRSRLMAAVRSKNTKPELLVRTALHASGLRYRIHVKELPGRPDIVFPKRRAVIQVHGCFWHGHSCRKGALPESNGQFWAEKIARNRVRDSLVVGQLHSLGWRSLTVWECALARSETFRLVVQEVERWVRAGSISGEMNIDADGRAVVLSN